MALRSVLGELSLSAVFPIFLNTALPSPVVSLFFLSISTRLSSVPVGAPIGCPHTSARDRAGDCHTEIEFNGQDHHCERLLVQQAFKIHQSGKMLVPIIDDAQFMPGEYQRQLGLLFEDLPRSHTRNLILIGQPPLMDALRLSINGEVRSRLTYSVTLQPLAPEIIQVFILDQLDRVGLAHNTISDDALALIIRSGEGPTQTHTQPLFERSH